MEINDWHLLEESRHSEEAWNSEDATEEQNGCLGRKSTASSPKLISPSQKIIVVT